MQYVLSKKAKIWGANIHEHVLFLSLIHISTEQRAPEASPTTNTAKGSFVNTLSQTLTAANAYLVSLLSQAGLKDLVPSHGDILVALFAQETVTMQELSEKIHRDPSTITALVKKLVLGGYVQTQKSITDKRRTEVSLTPKGKRLRSTFETISTTLVSTQMEGVDACLLYTSRCV